MKPLHLIIISVIIGVMGQVSIKKGVSSLGDLTLSDGIIAVYSRIFLSPYVVVGTLIYFGATFFWLYALSKVDLSYAYPFLALSYVLIIFASSIFLGESISILRWAGVLVICFGVFLISRS